MLHEITCSDCGDARKTRFRNTLRCVRCKILNDLIFVGERVYSCRLDGCTQRYRPVAVADHHCPAHATGTGRFAECPFCEQTSELHRADFPVCLTCMRDPAQRQRIIASLQRGQRERRQNNGIAAPTRRRLAS